MTAQNTKPRAVQHRAGGVARAGDHAAGGAGRCARPALDLHAGSGRCHAPERGSRMVGGARRRHDQACKRRRMPSMPTTPSSAECAAARDAGGSTDDTPTSRPAPATRGGRGATGRGRPCAVSRPRRGGGVTGLPGAVAGRPTCSGSPSSASPAPRSRGDAAGVHDHERLEAVRVRAGVRRARAGHVRERIGANATGLRFDSAAAVDHGAGGRTNPMANPGAIATTSFAPGADEAERARWVVDGLSRFAGRALAVDADVFASARPRTGATRASPVCSGRWDGSAANRPRRWPSTRGSAAWP